MYPAARESIRMVCEQEVFAGTRVAVASRTNRRQWARECMSLIDVYGGTTLEQACAFSEIFPGGKKQHFEKLRKESGVPYSEMLFFDNERINVQEVSQLGVTCVYCPGGMSQEAWEKGLKQHASK